MIENSVYIPYLQRNIIVTAKDIADLETKAKLAGRLRDSILDTCDMWHTWEGYAQAYEETLDSLRRCEDAI